MKKLIVLIFVITSLFLSCNNNDCNKLCFTEPRTFQFEFIDASSKENLFTNKTFDRRYIKIINVEDDSRVDFNFIDENDYNILTFPYIGWQTETIHYSIQINNIEYFTLYVDAERLSEDCCSFTRYNEIKIENTNYTLDEEKGIYSIFVE